MSAGSALSRRARLYLVSVILSATGAAALVLAREPLGRLEIVLVWTLAAAVAQLMSFPTPAGRGRITLSLTAHLCMVLVLQPGEILPALLLSRLAVATVERRPWYRWLFNVAQTTLAVLAASYTYRALGGATVVGATLPNVGVAIGALAAAAVLYYVLNVAAVSTVIALTTGCSVRAAWRQNYGYRTELVGTVALVLLAPVAALAYTHLGGFGLLLFVLPMLFLRDASVRYVVLRRNQETLIRSERQAARATLAAEVGHDINESLCLVQGQIQALQLRREAVSSDELHRRLAVALEHVRRIEMLSRGLVNFSRTESFKVPTSLKELIAETVDFLGSQRRFLTVRIRTELNPATRPITVDPMQIQQVLANLLINAAEAMEEALAPQREITVSLRDRSSDGLVEIAVRDRGPGVPANLRARVFDPAFTTRPGRRGYGLFVAFGIVHAHRGTIAITDAPGGGADVRITLPCDRVVEHDGARDPVAAAGHASLARSAA